MYGRHVKPSPHGTHLVMVKGLERMLNETLCYINCDYATGRVYLVRQGRGESMMESDTVQDIAAVLFPVRAPEPVVDHGGLPAHEVDRGARTSRYTSSP